MAIRSRWKITFAPGTGDAVVICDFDDSLQDELPWSGRQRVDVARPLEGAGVTNFARKGVEEDVTVVVEKDHASIAAAREYCIAHAIALPMGVTSFLQVEVQGGAMYRLAGATIMDWSRQIVTRVGKHRTRWTYRFAGGAWSVYTPPPP